MTYVHSDLQRTSITRAAGPQSLMASLPEDFGWQFGGQYPPYPPYQPPPSPGFGQPPAGYGYPPAMYYGPQLPYPPTTQHQMASRKSKLQKEA